MISNFILQPILAEEKLWIFDQRHLKEAVTLLLLKDLNEKNETDLELKKLISLQFENDSDMKTWAINFYDSVSFRNKYSEMSKRLQFDMLRAINQYTLGGQ